MPATTFIGHFLGPDTHANRPSATGLANGTLYVCTTHSKIERVVSGAWVDYATLGGGGLASDTLWDAKGDLAAGTGADTAAKLTVGADGQVLTADSTQTTGVKWATAGGGDLVRLSNTVLGADGTFDVSSISGSYSDLIVVLIARSTLSGNTDTPTIRFNNDSGGNYGVQRIRNDTGSTVGAQESRLTTTAGAVMAIPGSSALTNFFGTIQLTICGYSSTTWIKHFLYEQYLAFDTGANSSQVAASGGGWWNNTAAINRIQVSNGSVGNLKAGSQLRIYGRT